MVNIGEEIVCVWLQFCKNEFVMRNIPYRERKKGRDGKLRWTNREIDILSTDGFGKFSEYEAKWRTSNWVGHTTKEGLEKLNQQINNSYRRKKIKMILSSCPTPSVVPKRFLVTQKKHFGKAEKRKTRIKALKRKGIELLWFEDIFQDLLNYLDTDKGSGKFDPLILKTMRELKLIESDKNRSD